MRTISYPKTKTVILFGGSAIMPRLVEALQLDGYTVHGFTSPRQAQENLGTETLLQALTRVCRMEPVVTEDINAVFDLTLASDSIAIGLGEAWVFGREIREAFGDRLIDFMSIPLPRYRGGAHLTWAIMRGERQWGGSLQLITANTVPGECDDGEIVHQWHYEIPPSCRIPQHWFDYCGDRDVESIRAFLASMGDGKPTYPQPVAKADSLFLPRLKTVDNGWIDWTQPSAQIERQICAFDEPYPGARTFLHDPTYGDREVALRGVTWNGMVHENVPFQRGLVLRIQDGIHIATVNGTIVAQRVLYAGHDFTDRVKVGLRFVTPTERLERALTATPLYTPKAQQ
jgi:hypothetical protein